MAINVSPYATNVLDLIDRPLKTADGRIVEVRRSGLGFVVYVDTHERFRHDDNIAVSRYLNQLEVSL